MTTQVTTDVVAQIEVEDSTGSVSFVETQTELIEVVAEGPQGPAGEPGAPGVGIPPGGDPGNVLIKSTNADYSAGWTATVDGGTFN
jgi:hypothetical protein